MTGRKFRYRKMDMLQDDFQTERYISSQNVNQSDYYIQVNNSSSVSNNHGLTNRYNKHRASVDNNNETIIKIKMRKKLSQITNIKKISTTPLQYSKQPSFIINNHQESFEINLAENQEYEIKLNKSKKDEREQLQEYLNQDLNSSFLNIQSQKQSVQLKNNLQNQRAKESPINHTQQQIVYFLISTKCDVKHNVFQTNSPNLITSKTSLQNLQLFISQHNEEEFVQKILETLQSQLTKENQNWMSHSINNCYIHDQSGIQITSKSQINNDTIVLLICKHQEVKVNEEKLRKRYDQLQTTEVQKVQFFVKYDKNESNFQERYQRYLSKTQLKNPSKDSQTMYNLLNQQSQQSSQFLSQRMSNNASSLIKRLQTPISLKSHNHFADQVNFPFQNSQIISQIDRQDNFSKQKYNFVTNNRSIQNSPILKNAQNISQSNPKNLQEQISSFPFKSQQQKVSFLLNNHSATFNKNQQEQSQNQLSSVDLNQSYQNLLDKNFSHINSQKVQDDEEIDDSKLKQNQLKKLNYFPKQFYDITEDQRLGPHIQESSEVTTQKKLVIIQKKIQRYRKKRYHEFAKLENDNPKADQKAEFYIQKYFESPEVQKQSKLEKQLVKIPEVSHRVGYQSVQNSSQLLPIQDIRKHLNNSTFILKQKEKDLTKNQSRSASPQKPQNPFIPLSLHDKFLDHIENKKVINTFKEETLYEDIKGLWVKSNKFKQQKTQFRDKVKEFICKKRVTISAFDHKNKFKEGNSQRDHLKENTFKVIGEKQCVENIIKQNFQPLLQLNLPQLEQQTGFSRKDLFNLYTHFLSILRIQQTERQHLKCGKVSELTGIDFDIFRDNVPVIKYENKEVADKILSQIKAEVRDDQIQWADFLKYLKMILAKSFSEKIDIFFYAFDVDKNRMFSWDEVKAICTSCLGQMFSSQDEFVESLSLYFTKYIFEAVGFEKGQEIPVDEIKHAIRTASGEEGDLLKMFVGADGFNQQQQQENHGSRATL